MTPQKNMDTYERIFNKNTEFFSTYNPDMIEEALIQYLVDEYKVEPRVNQGKYKMKFALQTKNIEGGDEESEVCVRILQVSDAEMCAVEFTKLGGNNVTFLDHFNEISKALDNFNDAVPE